MPTVLAHTCNQRASEPQVLHLLCASASLVTNTLLGSRTKLLPVSVGSKWSQSGSWGLCSELGMGMGMGMDMGLGLGQGLKLGLEGGRCGVCVWPGNLSRLSVSACCSCCVFVRSSACVLLFMFTLIKVKGSRD